MKKQVLAFVLSSALIASLATGCQSSSSQPAGTSGSEKTTISLGMWPESTDKANVETFEKFKAQFEKTHPNVTVKPNHYVYAVDTYVAMAEAGTAPTIFESWYTEPAKLIKNKMITDVTDELKARGWDTEIADNIKPIVTDENGRIYGVPRDSYALGLMLNLNMFKKAGLMNEDGTAKYPKTWDELAQDAVTIKKATGKAGFCLLAKDNSGGWHFSNIAWCFGAQLEVQDGDTWKANFTSPEAIAAMQYVYDLKWKYDVLTASPTTVDWANGFVQLGTGNAAMLVASNDAVNNPTTTNGLATDALSLVPIPKGPNGDQYSLMGGTPYLFTKNVTPDQVNACLDFLEVMGKGPTASEDVVKGINATAETNVKNGTPNIYPFSAWTSKELVAAQKKAVDDNKNVDMNLYNDYFDFIGQKDALHVEEKADTQLMYKALNKVIQEVVTNKDANVSDLMEKANKDFQNTLDRNANKK